MSAVKCGYCDGIIAYPPYTEKIDGREMTFNAKA
jgi:hypothetical protein